MLLKMNLRLKIDAKNRKIRIESMSESANGKTINAFEERLMMQFRVHLIIHLALHLKVNFNIFMYKDAEEGAHDVALRGTLLVALGLQLSCICQCIRVYKIIQHFKDHWRGARRWQKGHIWRCTWWCTWMCICQCNLGRHWGLIWRYAWWCTSRSM